MLLAPRLLRQESRRYAPGEGSIPPVFCPGFPKGCPLWHTLLAKCSVLYLLAWLTGNGVRCFLRPVCSGRKQAVCSRRGQHTACFLSGFQRGAPFGFLQSGVLYLLAWLTGETGCGASCAPFAPAKTAVCSQIPPVFVSGFQRGVIPVLYLLAWLTGETGCGASCAPFAPAGKQAVCSRRGQHTACFVVRGFQRGAPFI